MSQQQKFINFAKTINADESPERFDDRLRKIAKSPPPEKSDKPKKTKPGQ